jgi:hypothetical protein
VNCLCGCGTRLRRHQVATNLLAGEVALELISWDKARALRSPVAAAEIEAIVTTGAPYYQELLAAIHAGEEPSEAAVGAIREWLERSREARARIGEQLSIVPKKKVKLSDEDAARADRVHPERSFSGGVAADPEAGVAAVPTALELELGSVLAAGRAGGEDYERLAVAWLARLVGERPPSLDELRWVLGRLEDVRAGRIEEAEPALRRFLADGS